MEKRQNFMIALGCFFRCIGAVDGCLSIWVSPSSSLVFAASRANLKGLLKAGREQCDECVARRCCRQRRSLTYSMKGFFSEKRCSRRPAKSWKSVGSCSHQREPFTPPCSCLRLLISPSVAPSFPAAFELSPFKPAAALCC